MLEGALGGALDLRDEGGAGCLVGMEGGRRLEPVDEEGGQFGESDLFAAVGVEDELG